MPRRYYSSTAVATTLSGSINNSTTSVTVTALSGFPNTTPWTAIIDKDTASEEVVTVTAVAGTTLTVTRGVDGTSAVSHNAGAGFSHGVSARDFDETNSHVNDTTTDVHSQYVLKSLVSGKGSLIAATADDTPADLPVGSNGQMLMADSSATAGLRYVDPPANRRLTINGDMQVSQRGTSSTGITASGYYTADRFNVIASSLGTWTQTVENDAPTGSGFRKSLKMLCTTADTSPAGAAALAVNQYLEGQDLQRIRKGTSDAQQLTVSFWVKSNVTGTYIVELFDLDNTRQVSASYSVSASATWERKTITFPADTTGAFDNDNASSLNVTFWLGSGSDRTSGTLNTTWASSTNANRAVGQTNVAAATNNYWQVTGVQLETGPVATPFEFEPYEATLRKCQRYYWLLAEGSNAPITNALYYSATDVRGVIRYQVEMRAGPSLVVTTGSGYYTSQSSGGGNDALDGFTISNANRRAGLIVNNTEAAGTAGQAAWLLTANASSAVALSAEL